MERKNILYSIRRESASAPQGQAGGILFADCSGPTNLTDQLRPKHKYLAAASMNQISRSDRLDSLRLIDGSIQKEKLYGKCC